jgi:cyclophilin family peptidyl-prolyl cis-trans isomerase
MLTRTQTWITLTLLLLSQTTLSTITVTDRAFIYVTINSIEQKSPIILDLFGADLPKTVASFRALCKGFIPTFPLPSETSIEQHAAVSFVGAPFHRVVKGSMVQTGDFDHKDGTGGFSLYGENFPDESFKYKHTTGSVSMANRGWKDSNGSQFFIVLADRLDAMNLDDKHVVFGRVALDGGLGKGGILRVIESYGTNDYAGRPSASIKISRCEVKELRRVSKNVIIDAEEVGLSSNKQSNPETAEVNENERKSKLDNNFNNHDL